MAWIENIRDVIGDPEDGKSVVTPSRNWSAVVPNYGSIEKTTLRTWAVKGADVILTVNYASAKVTWSDGEIEISSEEGKSETVKLSTTKESEEFTITASWFYESELYKDPVSDDGMVYLDIYDPTGTTVEWKRNEGSGTTVTNEFAMADVENVGQTPGTILTAGREYSDSQVKGRYQYDRWRKYLVSVYFSLILADEEIATAASDENGEKWTRISVGLIGTAPWSSSRLNAVAGETYTLTKTFSDLLIPELNTRESRSLMWTWNCAAGAEDKTHDDSDGSRSGGGSGSSGSGGSNGGDYGGGWNSEGKSYDESLVAEAAEDGVNTVPSTVVYVSGKGWRRVVSWRVEPESLSKNWDWDGSRTIYVVGDADLMALSTDEEWVKIDGAKISYEENTGESRSGTVTVNVEVRAVPYFNEYDRDTDTLSDATGAYSSKYTDSVEFPVYQGATGAELSEEELDSALEKSMKDAKSSSFGSSFSGSSSTWLSVDCAYLALESGKTAYVNVYSSGNIYLELESGSEYFTVENLGRTGEGTNYPYSVKIVSISDVDGAEGSLRISSSDRSEVLYVEINTSAPWISADPSLLYSYSSPELWTWLSYVRSGRKFTLSNLSSLPEWIAVEWKVSNTESEWKEVAAGDVYPAVRRAAGGNWEIPMFRILAGENEDSECRSAELVFTTESDVAGTRSATITVLQCGAGVVENKLSRAFYYVNNVQQTLEVEMSAKLGWEWTISGSSGWIRALETSGTGENKKFTVNFSIDAQAAGADSREAAFRIAFRSPDSSGAAQYDLTIRQSAGTGNVSTQAIRIVEGENLEFDSAGSPLRIQVETDGAEPVFLADSFLAYQIWNFELVSAEASGDGAIYTYELELYANDGYKKLEGEFSFILPAEYGGNSVTGTWTQAIQDPKELRAFMDAVFENRKRWKYFGRKWSGL